MKFWDSSAILPLLVEENESSTAARMLRDDASMIVWWGTSIECISALSRLEREKLVVAEDIEVLILRLRKLQGVWREVLPGALLRKTAERLLRVHPLQAQDAQQLAACVLINEEHSVPFVTFDKRLATAAQKEGISIAA